MVSTEEFKGWLKSQRARDLVEFVHERNEPPDEPLREDYQTIVELSGVPDAASTTGATVDDSGTPHATG
jgi:hypothetical protein